MPFLSRSNALDNLKNTHCPNGLVLYQSDSVRKQFPNLNENLQHFSFPLWSSKKDETLEETFSRGAQCFHEAVTQYILPQDRAKCIYLTIVADGDEPVEVPDGYQPMFCVTVHKQGTTPVRAEEHNGCFFLHFRQRVVDDTQQLAALIFAMVYSPNSFACREQRFVQAAFYDAKQQMCALRMTQALDRYFLMNDDEQKGLRDKVRREVAGQAEKISRPVSMLHPPVTAENWEALGGGEGFLHNLGSFLHQRSISKTPGELIREVYDIDPEQETFCEMNPEQISTCWESAKGVWETLKAFPEADASGNLVGALTKIFGDLTHEFTKECDKNRESFRRELTRSQSLQGSSVKRLKNFLGQSDKAVSEFMLSRKKLRILTELQSICNADKAFWDVRQSGLDNLRTAGNRARNILIPGLTAYQPQGGEQNIHCSWKMNLNDLQQQCSKLTDTWNQVMIQQLVAHLPSAENMTTEKILLFLDSDLSVENAVLRHDASARCAENMRIQNMGTALALTVLFSKPNIWEEKQNAE